MRLDRPLPCPVVDEEADLPVDADAVLPLEVLLNDRLKKADDGIRASSLIFVGAHARPRPRSRERPFVPDRWPTLGTGTGGRSPRCGAFLSLSLCLSRSSLKRSFSCSTLPPREADTSGFVPVLLVLRPGETGGSKENKPCWVAILGAPLLLLPKKLFLPVALLILDDFPVCPVPLVEVDAPGWSECAEEEPWGVFCAVAILSFSMDCSSLFALSRAFTCSSLSRPLFTETSR
jgi:hypothetical protein